MICVNGKAVFQGIAIGRITIYNIEETQIAKGYNEDTKSQLQCYERAKAQVKAELNHLYEKSVSQVGELNAQIFKLQAAMLDDKDYNASIYNMINIQHTNAEYAVTKAGEDISKQFANMTDEHFKARSVDIKDISERVAVIIKNNTSCEENIEELEIFLTDKLTPNQAVRINKNKVAALVTQAGSKNSHTAVIAETMAIPALAGITAMEDWHGKLGIVDGFAGKLYIEPDENLLYKYKQKQLECLKNIELLNTLKNEATVTKNGKQINLYASINNQSDIEKALENGAEGIGLFRTEFLYLESNTYPTEEKQFQIYKYAAQEMADKKVIIRTLDIGSDKQPYFLRLPFEENPAMGYRGIRVCLDKTEMFKAQLRAILRASLYGKIAIMFPTIVSVKEVIKAKALLEEARQELLHRGIECRYIETGIMIETPAAVMISDTLAKEVDFFSIGTNDLTQYTLAADRLNPCLDNIYDMHHEAILKMIQMVTDNAHANGVSVTVCGAMSQDITLTRELLKIGIDGLTVSSSMVLPVRKVVRDSM